MKLVIAQTLQTAVFFEVYKSVTESYGIIKGEKGFETKEYEDTLPNALAILSLDELLTRHVYAFYDTDLSASDKIENFTYVDGDHKSIDKLIQFISNEGNLS